MFSIEASAYKLMHRVSAARSCRRINKVDKKLFESHKGDWDFLTAEELHAVGNKSKYAYAAYKNMAGSENLSYYVPNALYKTVLLPILNPLNHSPYGKLLDSCFSDKNYAERIMDGLLFPKVILRRLRGQLYDPSLRRITEEEALALLAPHSELVFKCSIDSGHGHGIKLLQANEFKAALSTFADDYVVQERLRQHECLSYFNESSVNILRVTSLCWRGEIYILGGILRIGAPGSFCDHTPHGNTHNLDVALNDDGSFKSIAFDPDHCHVYDNVYGKEIRGCIPNYDRLKELIIQEHAKYPCYGLIGWDFTLDEKQNFVCMEFNTKWPGIKATQYGLGPVFAKESVRGVPLLDEILGR